MKYKRWNDEIVVLKKTTLQLYFKTFIEKTNSYYIVEPISIQCSRLHPHHRLDTDPELGACLFHKCRRELGGWRRPSWLWCCGRSCWWCSRRMTKRSSPAGSGRRRRGASERRIQSRSTPSEAKPGSLFTTLFSASRYTLVLTFKPTSKMWGGMMWPSLETTPKTITVAGNFVFIDLGTSLLFVAIQICILRVLAMVLLS